jgi:hypothetical protein
MIGGASPASVIRSMKRGERRMPDDSIDISSQAAHANQVVLERYSLERAAGIEA